MLDEIENHGVDGHADRCTTVVADCVLRLGESAPDLFTTKLCPLLLEKLRHQRSTVRRRALNVFEKVVDRAQDALAPLLPTIVQHIREATEGES